jgi:glutamine amidotransferase
MNNSICILDYGSGNVKSVSNICSSLAETIISNDPRDILSATHVILPGVGSFGKAMEKINKLIPLDVLLDEVQEKKKPFLGICVGMQVMLSKGYEFGEWDGLNLIAGKVELIDTELSLPHVGWNDLNIEIDNPITQGLPVKPDFYFVHSYRVTLDDREEILAETNYGVTFPSVVRAKETNAFGVQFHPEKSQQTGRKILSNFLAVKQ